MNLERAERVLVVCPAGSAESARQAVGALARGAAISVLAVGRAPTPPSIPAEVLVPMPPRSPLGIVRWLVALRGRRAQLAVIALPSLGVNQSRGALLGIALAAGTDAAVGLDPVSGARTAAVGPRGMLVEAFRFALLNAAGAVAAVVIGPLLSRTAAMRRGKRLPQVDPRRPPGDVVYLRTDVELAIEPLRAGGSLAHTLGILRALRRRGHRVTLATTGELDTAGSVVDEERRLPAILPANVPRELSELVSGVRQGLRRLPSGPPPDYIYQRHSFNNLAGVLIARRLGVPLILEANASEVHWRQEWSSLRMPSLGRACERLIFGEATRIASVSENAAVHLRDAGAPTDRIRIVPNGVEVERFATAEPRPLPFEDGAFVIGFTGLFYPWHGVRYLAEAFPLVLERVPEARLLLVGDGEDAPFVRDMLARAGVIDRVLMTGLVPAGDVPGYLRAADVLATPHDSHENFIGSPIKLWEYMASGRPTVASRLAQLGDVLEHEKTALLVPPRDPEALAAALVRLHDEPELAQRIGAAAQSEARERHSWDARLAQILE